MVESWLSPILGWLGIGLVPFLLIVIVVILLVKGD